MRLFLAYLRVSVAGEAGYRINFFVQFFQSIVGLGTSLGGLSIIFSYTSLLGGWRPDEVLMLPGIYFLVGGIIGSLIRPGMEDLIESVRTGTIDFTLVKPADAQVLVSIRRSEMWQGLDILLGFGVLAYALVRLGTTVGLLRGLEFTGMLVAGAVIVYSLFLMLATLSFWFIRVINVLEIFQKHVRGRALAGESLPRIAALRSHFHRPGRIRDNRPGRGPHWKAKLGRHYSVLLPSHRWCS